MRKEGRLWAKTALISQISDRLARARPALASLIAAIFWLALPARAEVPDAVPADSGKGGEFQVAQVQTLDNWQQRAFNAIEEQKRLDALPRVNSRRTTVSRSSAPKTERRRAVLGRKPVPPMPSGADVAGVVPPQQASEANNAAEPETVEFDVVLDAGILQRCLRDAGAFDGEMTGKLDKPTFAAFNRFRAEQKLTFRPENPYDPVLQQKLFAACGHPDGRMPAEPVHEAEAEPSIIEAETQAVVPADEHAMPVAAQEAPATGGLAFGATSSVPPRMGFASANASSSSSRVRITDLFSSRPAPSNTCAPQPGGLLSPEAGVDPVVTGAVGADQVAMKTRANTRQREPIVPIEDARACLPRDLYDMLTGAYGAKPDLVVCKSDCMPAPEAFSDGERKLFAKQYALSWCGDNCLAIGDPMPLDDIMRIEKESNTPVCVKPQTALMTAEIGKLDADGTTPAIRALFDQLPGGYGNADNIAVIIGNRAYGKDIGVSAAAGLNAAAMKALLLGQLGYKPENILMVQDAKRDDFVRLFGGKDATGSELAKRLKANPNAQLTIYYAGHASSQRLGLENYLLPVDAVAGREAETGYALDQLYENLRKLDARSTMLFVEAGFGERRDGSVLPPNVSERKVMVAPVTPVRGLTVFTAAEGDQQPLVDAETGLGFFTRYLITGLAGKADAAPFGNADSILDSVELHVHVAQNVQLAARKTLGLMQSPTLSRTDNLFLSQLSRK